MELYCSHSALLQHPECVVHGLWPEVGSYGTSECLAPANSASPQIVYPCYNQEGEQQSDLLSFEVKRKEERKDKHLCCLYGRTILR